MPVAQPAPATNPVQVASSAAETPLAMMPFQAPSNDLASGSPGGSVTGSRGALDGPDGETVASAATSSADLPWWRDASVVGTSLAALATPPSVATGSTSAGPIVEGAANLDAAELQRQQLLRQSIAALQPSAGGSAAIWAHAAANDDGLTVASSSAQQSVRPMLSAAVGG